MPIAEITRLKQTFETNGLFTKTVSGPDCFKGISTRLCWASAAGLVWPYQVDFCHLLLIIVSGPWPFCSNPGSPPISLILVRLLCTHQSPTHAIPSLWPLQKLLGLSS